MGPPALPLHPSQYILDNGLAIFVLKQFSMTKSLKKDSTI